MNKPLILAVEDDTAVRNLITTTLETQDYRFQTWWQVASGVGECEHCGSQDSY